MGRNAADAGNGHGAGGRCRRRGRKKRTQALETRRRDPTDPRGPALSAAIVARGANQANVSEASIRAIEAEITARRAAIQLEQLQARRAIEEARARVADLQAQADQVIARAREAGSFDPGMFPGASFAEIEAAQRAALERVLERLRAEEEVFLQLRAATSELEAQEALFTAIEEAAAEAARTGESLVTTLANGDMSGLVAQAQQLSQELGVSLEIASRIAAMRNASSMGGASGPDDAIAQAGRGLDPSTVVLQRTFDSGSSGGGGSLGRGGGGGSGGATETTEAMRAAASIIRRGAVGRRGPDRGADRAERDVRLGRHRRGNLQRRARGRARPLFGRDRGGEVLGDSAEGVERRHPRRHRERREPCRHVPEHRQKALRARRWRPRCSGSGPFAQGGGGGGGGLLGGLFGGLFGGFRASGGPVSGGTPYVVGERGPELFVPNTSGNILPGVPGGSASVSVNVINNSGQPVERRESRGPDGQRLVEITVGRAIAEGRFDRAMAARFGNRAAAGQAVGVRRSLTPTPPPFSGMNSTPARSSAARMICTVGSRSASPRSRRATVVGRDPGGLCQFPHAETRRRPRPSCIAPRSFRNPVNDFILPGCAGRVNRSDVTKPTQCRRRSCLHQCSSSLTRRSSSRACATVPRPSLGSPAATGETPDTKKARNALHVYLPLLAERAGALNTALEAEERRQQAG